MSLSTNLVSYYKFDADNSNDAVASNNGTDTAMTYSSAAGKINDGASFNGSTSKIALPSGVYSLFTGTSPWSFNAWINVQTSGTAGRIFQTYNAGGAGAQHNSFQLFISGALPALLGVTRGDNFSIDELDSSTSVIASTGTWYMVTAKYDGTTLSLYANATSAATPITSTRGGTAASSSALGVNLNVSANFWPGYMDEVGIWSRTLSDTEITSLYNAGLGKQYPFPGGGLALLGVG